jgi:tetratricopeptide (TPR) repeat protein
MTTASETPGERADLDALVALAKREHRAGRLAEAAAACGQILAIRPDMAEVHNDLGIILAQQDQLDLALARFEQAVALRPDYTDAHINLGNVLLGQGKLDEAVARYEYALTQKPGYAQTYYNLGNVLKQQGKLDQAAARFEQALALRPNYADAHNNLGNVLLGQGKLDEAAARYQHALTLRPDFAEAHYNLAGVRRQQGRLAEATALYEQALANRPDYSDAHYNLGFILRDQGKLDEAAARYAQALAIRPDLADAQLGLAGCYLAAGDYQRGWPAYEERLRIPGVVTPHGLPLWTDQPLAGRSLLLLAEQGLGDTLLFVRYARLLKERGARIVLAVQAPLGRLLAPDGARHGLAWDELFILGSAEELPQCDFCLPLASAPSAFGATASTIPCEVPYLWADAELTAQWRAELAKTDGFKIGIVWQGSRDYPSDRWRSAPLAQFAPLARLPGVRLVSLQKGFGAGQVATVDFPIVDIAGRLDEAAGPFMDTAAVLGSLDLVVTVDTAIAHLAGSLGVPVWVALPLSPYWVWLLDRDDSPWYPTMRLFRQTVFDGWADVFERIAQAVQARRSENASSKSA